MLETEIDENVSETETEDSDDEPGEDEEPRLSKVVNVIVAMHYNSVFISGTDTDAMPLLWKILQR